MPRIYGIYIYIYIWFGVEGLGFRLWGICFGVAALGYTFGVGVPGCWVFAKVIWVFC